jgi:hypothetical protein
MLLGLGRGIVPRENRLEAEYKSVSTSSGCGCGCGFAKDVCPLTQLWNVLSPSWSLLLELKSREIVKLQLDVCRALLHIYTLRRRGVGGLWDTNELTQSVRVLCL